MIYSDAPITNEDNDELNRMPFVKRLSSSISEYGPTDCLVIGLMGEWGCGKSSIMNLTFNEIEKRNKDWIFVKFDPWYFSNQDNLILQFFNVLFNEMSLSKKISRKSKNLFKKFIKGVTLSLNYEVISASLNFEKMLSEEEYKKFTTFKRDLNNIFSDLNCKIVISIDNIDRLTHGEINQIFMLVKSLADFPNVIYILSFDNEIVLKSVDELKISSPENFLKKIIQIPITVPQITESNLEILIHNHIEPIYDEYVETENRFLDTGFWELLGYLKPFLKNIRDLKRYVNILNFYCDGLIDNINIIDFMLILAIQTFQNQVYHQIKNNKELLTQTFDGQENLIEDLDKLYEIMANRFHDFDKYALAQLLIYLFPIFSEVFGETMYVRRNVLKNNFRISERKHFDKYFTLSLEESEVSDFYINSMAKYDIDKLTEEFLLLRDDAKLNSLLDKLYKKIGDFNLETSKKFITAFFEVGDEFFNEFTMYNAKVNSILNKLFNHLKTDECCNILNNALDNSKGLFTIIEFIYGIGYDYGEYSSKYKSEKDLCITKNEFKILERKVHRKINEIEPGKLIDNNYLSILLKYWEDIGDKEEVKKFVEMNTKDSHILIEFIYKFRRKYNYSQSKSKDYTYDFEKLNRYFDLKKLSERIESNINSNELSDIENDMCKHFMLKYKERYRLK